MPGQQHTPVLVATGEARVVPRTVSRVLTPILSRIAGAYARQDLASIANLITDTGLRHSVRGTMQRWIEEGVNPLHITLVYAHALAGKRYVGTVEFWSDPRAIPAYMIFVFGQEKAGLRIVGTATGIQGNSYQDAVWTLSKSAHFRVYHSPFMLAGSDAMVLKKLEAQRTLFERKFGVHVASSISYYLYPTQPLMASMSHNACGHSSEYVGCALPYEQPPTIHTIEWPSYHEPIHVYELALEPPVRRGKDVYVAPLFIAEGTAVALEDKSLDPRASDFCSDLTYISLDSCAQQVEYNTNPLSSLSDKAFLRGDQSNEYLVAGSFVKYLILHYGYKRFGKFYYTLAAQPKDTRHDYDVASKTVYQVGIAGLVRQWTRALCSSGC